MARDYGRQEFKEKTYPFNVNIDVKVLKQLLVKLRQAGIGVNGRRGDNLYNGDTQFTNNREVRKDTHPSVDATVQRILRIQCLEIEVVVGLK